MPKLTERQRELLIIAAEYSTPRMLNPIYKRSFAGKYWRVFDRLEERGLLELRTGGRYIITEAGREALAAVQ